MMVYTRYTKTYLMSKSKDTLSYYIQILYSMLDEQNQHISRLEKEIETQKQLRLEALQRQLEYEQEVIKCSKN